MANGTLKDGDTVQTDDAATQAALLALWTDLELTGAAAETKSRGKSTHLKMK